MNKIVLELDGKTYLVVSSTLNSYNRNSDSDPYPGDNTFTLQIKMSRVDQNILDWFYNVNGMKKNGKITMYREDETPFFVVSFTDAYSHSFNSNMNSQDSYGNDLNVTFVANNITLKYINQTVTASKPQTN